MGDVSATFLAVVVVPPEGLNAERNEAEAEDPAAKQAYEEAQEPLQSGFLHLQPGFTLFAAVVALHLGRPHVASRLAVWPGQAWWSRCVDVLHGWGLRVDLLLSRDWLRLRDVVSFWLGRLVA